jgi:type II secretory pathway pseudopilin PulG
MGSVRCANCGFISFADAEHCKRCGNDLRPQQPSPGGYSPSQFGAFTKPKAGLAVASLALGVVGFFTLGLLGVGAITGIVLGAVAVARANNRPEEYGGRGAAIAGIVLNGLALVVVPFIAIVAAIAIPNLIASRRAANEGSAIGSIRSISLAEEDYFATAGQSRNYATLAQLHADGLIDDALSGGTKNGYRFRVTADAGQFVVQATPVAYRSTGVRSFYYSSSDGVIRAADARGRDADSDAKPLAGYSPPRRAQSAGTD